MTATVFDDRPCELGEGPLWHPERGEFFWFDILGCKLLSRRGAQQLAWSLPEMCSAAAWLDRDTLLIAGETGLRRFEIATGSHEPVVSLEADNPATRSNDGRADPHGGFWIGTMGKAEEPGCGAIYRYYGGVLEKVIPDVSIPNAICFPASGDTAYYADTVTRTIMRQALDADGWPTGSPETFTDMRGDGLYPDGAVIDSEGGLWSAQWGAGRVARYRPDGTFDRAHAVGGRHASCPAFGGPGLADLLVTTARKGMADPDPAQGLTYLVDAGVTGLPEPCVRL
jgi:sugar lactone lactonase YvrE